MKRILLTLTLLLTASLITGCGSKDTTPTEETTETAVQNNQYDSRSVNFDYPEGWVLRESDTPVGRVIILYAPESETGVNTNLNIIIQDLSKSEETPTLETYTEISKKSLEDVVVGLDVLSEKAVKVAGNPGFEISYKGSTKDMPNKKFQWWQAWTVVGDQAYILTLTGSPESIKDYKASADLVLSSFFIK